MAIIASKPPPPGAPASGGKFYKIRPLKRSDRDAAFKLLAEDGWEVNAADQETAISWIVQHPEMESFVAHDAASFSRLFGFITMSHRPQLRVAGRVACIDAFAIAPEQRHKGIGVDLLENVLRRAEALGCKRMEIALRGVRDGRHDFFEKHGFVKSGVELFVLKK